MPYLIAAFAAGVVTTAVIALYFFQWDFGKLIDQLETELTEAKRLLRVREEQRDEVEEIAETMDQRITFLESQVKRLQGYETAVRELNRSVEILEEDVPF